MNQFEELSREFNAYLQKNQFAKEPQGLYGPIDYILEIGGKRFRPALLLMACRLFGGDHHKAMPAALAIEVFHNFTLVHDDIMDDAPLRRGRPAVHTQYNLNTGILSGDVMLILVYQLLLQLENRERQAEWVKLFNETAIKVCEGQQYDIDFETRTDVTIPEYLKMIEYKTAVLMACALQLGALIGGASQEEAAKLYTFGKLAGIAFQLQDDLLDTYGDPRKFGKKPGGDILQNKKTFLTLKTLEISTAKNREELRYWMSTPTDQNDEKVQAVINLYNAVNVKEITRKTMLQYLESAYQALEQVHVDANLKMPLRQLAEGLIHREV